MKPASACCNAAAADNKVFRGAVACTLLPPSVLVLASPVRGLAVLLAPRPPPRPLRPVDPVAVRDRDDRVLVEMLDMTSWLNADCRSC